MKKALIVVLALVVASAGIYWFVFRQNRNYPETILPENTALYLYFPGLDEVRKQASETLLWKRIAASPRKGLYQNQLQRLMSFTESVVGVDPRPLLSQFTRETVLAVLPITGNTQSGSLIAYVRKEKQTREFLELKMDPSLKRRFPDLRKATVPYLDHEYYKYSSTKFREGVSPCYAFVDHHLIVTTSEVGMKVLFEVKNGKLQPLKKNGIFDDAKGEVHHKNGVLLFLNGKSLFDVLKNRLPARAKAFWPAFLKISGVEAVQGFTYRLGAEGEGFREEGYVSVNRKREGFAKAYMEQQPQKLSGLSFLPASSEAAGAGTLPDSVLVWKEVQAQVQGLLSGGQFSQWRSMLEFLASFLNFDMERDLVEPMGRQFSFATDSSGTNPGGEQPRYFIALELKKPDQFRDLIEKLILLGQQRGLQRQAQLYQGKTLQILDVRAGGMNAVPALWIEGSWFYFGTAEDFVKQSIDAVKSKQTLPTNADFKKVTTGFPAELNSISYTNTQATMRRYAAALQQQSNEADRGWIREYGLIEEMNDLSKNLFGAGSYSVIEKEGIRYQSYSSVPTSFFLLPPVISVVMK